MDNTAKPGNRFGKIVLVSFLRHAIGSSLWLCRCDCGRELELKFKYLNRSSHCGYCQPPQSQKKETKEERSLRALGWRPGDTWQVTARKLARKRKANWIGKTFGQAVVVSPGIVKNKFGTILHTWWCKCGYCNQTFLTTELGLAAGNIFGCPACQSPRVKFYRMLVRHAEMRGEVKPEFSNLEGRFQQWMEAKQEKAQLKQVLSRLKTIPI